LSREKRLSELKSRAGELEHRSCAATNGGVQGVEPVGAHDGQARQFGGSHIVDASNQRIHAGPVFMVHLRQFARLRERVCFINEQDRRGSRLFSGGRLWAMGFQVPKGVRNQTRHFTDRAATAGAKAKGEQFHREMRHAGEAVAECRRQFRFSRSYISGENKERGAAAKQVERGEAAAMFFLAPFFEKVRTQQRLRLFLDPLFHFIQADQGLVAVVHVGIGETNDVVEEARGHN
jgi:hypothetical protein